MKKLFFLLLLFVFTQNAFSQDFYDNKFRKSKKYILLTNPTVNNLKTIQYLVNASLLDIKKGKMKFVGVYYEGQNYDFRETKKYIEENGLKNYHLQEIKGKLDESNLFEENECTAGLKKVFENSVGVFFFGGPDIPPGVYEEENSLSVVTDAGRHYFETTFLFHLLGGYRNTAFQAFLIEKPKYMVTGFCLGMQTMNVATGGTLIQDIPAEIYEAKTPGETLKLGRTNLHRNYWQEISDDTLLLRKFHPEDKPMSYNDVIGKQSVKFHEKYWGHISDVLRKARRK